MLNQATNPAGVPAPEPATPGIPGRRRNAGLLGVALFVVSESTFFLGVFFAYFYLRSQAEVWPPPGVGSPTITLAVLNTVISLASSAALAYGARSIARDDKRGLTRGVAAAAILGMLFMAVQTVEFSQLNGAAQTSDYGAVFTGLLFFHVARVFLGVSLMLIVLLRAFLGQFSARRRLMVQATALYWYFITAVWLVVFAVLYLVK